MEKWSEEGWERRQQAFLIFFLTFFRFLEGFSVLERSFFGAVASRGLLGSPGALSRRFGPSGVA